MFNLTFTGNLGRDVEKRVSKEGTNFYTFNVGVKTGKTTSSWVQCSMGDKLGDKIAQYLVKGTKVLVIKSNPTVHVYKSRTDEIVGAQQAYVMDLEILTPKTQQSGDNYVLPEKSADLQSDDLDKSCPF